MDHQERDEQVRRYVYGVALSTGAPPTVSALSDFLRLARDEVEASLRRLADAHVLVLQPDRTEILMAAPFSAVPTPFLVRAGEISCFANCIWDALGVAAMLHQDAQIDTSCQDCGGPMSVEVRADAVSAEGLVHFAVPAKEWWADIVFT